MTEASPLVRQWILLRTLCTRHYGVTIKELSAETGVSEKTIRRDLETFQTAGFPLVETVEEFGRKKWHIDPGKHEPGMCFAYDEAVALYLGRRFLEPLAGTMFWEAAQRALKKIRASLGRPALHYVDRFSTMFHQTMVGVSDYSKKAELIDELLVGIEDRRAVFITYQSLQATEPVTYDVYPYGLTYHHGSLYLVGQKVERGQPESQVHRPGTGSFSGSGHPGTDRRLVEVGRAGKCACPSTASSPGRGQGEGERGLSRFSSDETPTEGWSGAVPLASIRHGKVDRGQSESQVPSPIGRGQGEGSDADGDSIRHGKVDRGQPESQVPSPVGRGQGEGERGLSRFSSDGTPTEGWSGTVPLASIRHWKVDRIEKVKLEEFRFNRPEDFDLRAHFANSFGVFQGDGEVHVKVRFSPTVARYVEESKWHASQRLTKEKDGSLVAEFDLDGTEEIMRWILSFGQHAVVLEPEALMRGIWHEIRTLTSVYEHHWSRGDKRADRTGTKHE